MPHRSFGAVRRDVVIDPIQFNFGLYYEHTFTVMPNPSIGDTFDVADAPDPTPTNTLEVARVLAIFIRRMLVEDDKKRFDQALYQIPITEMHLVIEAAEYITEQVTTFPTTPPSDS